MNRFTAQHILGIYSLSPDEITLILDTAESLKDILERPIKKVPPLRGKTVVHLFFEPSTRTRLSFELAAKRLSADTVSISASTSSVLKGETLIDTARNIEAMRPDVIVMRHPQTGTPHLIAKYVKSAVINAGDGINEHPSQALLDVFTVRQHLGHIDNLKVAILGDIIHSRVAHSDILAFTKMGAKVVVSGPATMLPSRQTEVLGAKVVLKMEDALKYADVIIALRIQKERQGQSLIPSLREYALFFGLSPDKLRLAKSGALIMHPGPINRGVEMAPEVADGPYSVILDQVTNGVAIRMALLSLLLTKGS
ncbi:MAG: aspartate carbamoyltransferase [delta proteobacterium ML8_D]|jgi:aspartate carbamoyltransferase catalytic subunit|nr:MAG: aspartate carbamoyltransferase [delta proteobacterium ML8_D]